MQVKVINKNSKYSNCIFEVEPYMDYYISKVGPEMFNKHECIQYDSMEEDNKTIKNDEGKPKYSDLPVKTLRSVTKAFNYGAKKYAKYNYTKGLEYTRYYDACLRHLEAWREFEDIDVESGNHHIDHAIASLMMLRENLHLNTGTDDRNPSYKK